MSSNQEHLAGAGGHPRMSDLMDARVDRAGVEAAVREWRSDPAARQSWHTYHLIGDVLRSEEMGAQALSDAAFVSALRERLADEPVPLAPAAAPRGAHFLGWSGAVAAAVAGVAVVGGVAFMLKADPTASGRPSAAELAAAAAPAQVALSGQLIRDAELDRYFAAHRRAGGSSVMAVPGAVVRSVETVAIDAK